MYAFENKLPESPEIAEAPGVIGIVMSGTFDHIPALRRFGRLENLATKLNGNNLILVPMDDQLWKRQLRQPVDQSMCGSKEPMHG